MVCEVLSTSSMHDLTLATSTWGDSVLSGELIRARETHQVQRYLSPHRLRAQSQVHLEEAGKSPTFEYVSIK